MENFWDQIIYDLNKPQKKTVKLKRIRSRYYAQQSYFTAREYQCIKLINSGLTMKQTGEKLDLSPRTVEFYIQTAKLRFKLKKTKDLIAIVNNNTIKKVET